MGEPRSKAATITQEVGSLSKLMESEFDVTKHQALNNQYEEANQRLSSVNLALGQKKRFLKKLEAELEKLQGGSTSFTSGHGQNSGSGTPHCEHNSLRSCTKARRVLKLSLHRQCALFTRSKSRSISFHRRLLQF
jgi:hypothetical protein